MATSSQFDLIFTRPSEPIYLVKNKTSSRINSRISDEFYTERDRDLVKEIKKSKPIDTESRLDTSSENPDQPKTKQVTLEDFTIPKLDYVEEVVKRDDLFSMFLPLHRKIASGLVDLLYRADNVEKLYTFALYCRDRVNPALLNYALSVVLLHRKDTQNVLVPSFAEVFPDRFFESGVFQETREQLSFVPEESRVPITVDSKPELVNKNPETRVAYFREDIGICLNYYNWHMIYPTDAEDVQMMVDKDRRGELWYYLHEQILARYNVERLCNKLALVRRINSSQDPIVEGFFPKLNSQNTSQSWPPRFEDTKLRDLNRPNDRLKFELETLNRWIDQVKGAIEKGKIEKTNGEKISINNDKGIDYLGNIVQSSALSVNRSYYGDISNMGHAVISYCHDPDNKFREAYGVLGEPATALRDPVFYRWHTTLSDIFQHHKSHLKWYKKEQLSFNGINLMSIEIQFQNKKDGSVKNELRTNWQNTDFDITRGLDFNQAGSIFVRNKHLQHVPFTYKLKVVNESQTPTLGTVRIFMAPKHDEQQRLLNFSVQRLLMIEMDRFVFQFQPGENFVIRRSDESSVTIPYDNTFNPEAVRRKIKSNSKDKSIFCICGWPQHMLVPKGTEEGKEFVLYGMVSNDTPVDEGKLRKDDVPVCTDASSYSGIFNRKYPDKRPMGFPFDRPAAAEFISLDTFLQPNMATQNIIIRFTDKTILKENLQDPKEAQAPNQN